MIGSLNFCHQNGFSRMTFEAFRICNSMARVVGNPPSSKLSIHGRGRFSSLPDRVESFDSPNSDIVFTIAWVVRVLLLKGGTERKVLGVSDEGNER